MENKKIGFKGDGTVETGEKIIKHLKDLGGINYDDLSGAYRSYYYIDHNNKISKTN